MKSIFLIKNFLFLLKKRVRIFDINQTLAFFTSLSIVNTNFYSFMLTLTFLFLVRGKPFFWILSKNTWYAITSINLSNSIGTQFDTLLSEPKIGR